MTSNIEEVLGELDAWYSELPNGSERPKLLSKLATLELCGWIEERIDCLAVKAAMTVGVQATAAVQEKIDRTYGFSYSKHVRPRLVAIGGELLAVNVEASFERNQPGELDRLRNLLGTLWHTRKTLAHISFVGPMATQVTLNAPSWSMNQQRDLSALIDEFERQVLLVLPGARALAP